MALIDPFGREITYLRISVTDRCNLKCNYCMPMEPRHTEREEVLTFEEIDRLVGVAVSLGWRKVRLTGGEPLVRKDLTRLVEMLGRHKRSVNGGPRLEQLVMTSNAILLSRFARDLRKAGLDRVNVSLDTLRRDRFLRITGYDKLQDVREGIEAAARARLAPVKLNTVLIRGSTEDELMEFVELARSRSIDVRFIEFMPFAGNEWSLDKVVPSQELKDRVRTRFALRPLDPPRDGGPARTLAGPGWAGTVSFISPISDREFCRRCNRVRLTAVGKLRGCLLDEDENDFRAALRAGVSDAELADLFRRALEKKIEAHPYHEQIRSGSPVGAVEGRGMHRIGG
jgi:cyclic pyranopterin phosphate synthase